MKMRPVLLIQGFLACLPLVSSAGEDVQARFERSLAEARHLSNYNYEIEWTDAYTNYDEPVLHATSDRPFWRIVQYSYEASGARYRASCTLISGSQTNLIKLTESAFDGKERVDYGSSRRMTVGNQVSDLNAADTPFNPMTVAFGFVRNVSRDDPISCLRFQDIASIEPGSIMIPTASVRPDGLLELSMAHQTISSKIILDTDGDSFTPKTSISRGIIEGATVEGLMEFLNYTNLEGYRFPGKIVFTESVYSPTGAAKLRSAIVVTLISARVISDPIPDSVFRLDNESNAAVFVWDAHKHGYIKTPPHTNAAALAAAGPKIYDESADGSKQIADALVTASKERKRVLLMFGANWCGWCHLLHNLFQTDQSISDVLKANFVVVMVDVNSGHNSVLNARYGNPTRYGLPVIVILDAEGKQLTTENTGQLEEGDHHSPQKVLAFLKTWASPE